MGHAEWYEPDSEGQMLYVFTQEQNSGIQIFFKKDNRVEGETLGRGILVGEERGDKKGSWGNDMLTQKKIKGL